MLKKQRVAKVVGDLSDALDIAQAMLRSGEVEAARLHMHAAINNAGIDIHRAATAPDDYPPQYRAQFEAVAALLDSGWRRESHGGRHEMSGDLRSAADETGMSRRHLAQRQPHPRRRGA